MSYAVVLGEALVDLLEGECDGQLVYRQAIGGAPLNVAVGVARLGGAVEFAGSLGDDVLAGRIRTFLDAAGVGVRGVVEVAAPTTLAVATFTGAEPDFRFYGEPPSYGLLAPDSVDPALVADAAVLYCGSIALLCPPVLAAARQAWAATRGLRVFDPNVRPRMLPDAAALAGFRAVVAEFAATAHLVKLSAADAEVLYDGASPEEAARRLRAAGAGAVVVTRGAAGAVVAAGDGTVLVEAPAVEAVDATGAGDSVMAALIAELLAEGLPDDASGWLPRVAFALRVAALVCESPGGAVAMPTRADVARRFRAEGM
ncbi:fructokinase [Micromonospora pattaloongensis]|uniref:Fructokinase n=1 Tax=Micromonospora pattaloongensis TaxID=405436 RepID=A0A1H3QEV1_9ACTN|nr:PfkB family carbohydrate kinase [Micromonospora pattaloongensis]SDZ11545.1 fructokinase [Micromonospora pattaloongensis]